MVFRVIAFILLGKRGREEGEQAGPSKRPARSENRIEGVVRTRPTYDGFEKPKSFKGGERFKFQTNYFQVSAPNWTIHKYHTTFEVSSTVDKKKERKMLKGIAKFIAFRLIEARMFDVPFKKCYDRPA